jgi:RNase adapter protein RapZ
MRLVVISGMSGSGKSVALNMLEDLGWFCIDNIPAALLQSLVSHTLRKDDPQYRRLGVGLDARNRPEDLAAVPALLADLRRSGLRCELIYLRASDDVLLRRYAETRRRHPLAAEDRSLSDAITSESALLLPLIDRGGPRGRHVLDERPCAARPRAARVDDRREGRLSILFESFGFKHGIPGDADFVFDARTLPNPYWEPALARARRPRSRGAPLPRVEPVVEVLFADLVRFLEARIPEFQRANRGYLTWPSAAPAGSTARCTWWSAWRRISARGTGPCWPATPACSRASEAGR